VGEHDPAERGDTDRLRPARTVEHRAADGLLQPGDLLTHRRLGIAEPRCRPAERTLVDDGRHGGEMAQLDLRHSRHATSRTSDLPMASIVNHRFSA
jgi:hypothetical protein